MPLFRKKDKSPKGNGGLVLTELDEILAYLDELIRRRVPLSFVVNKKSYQTDILFLESKTKSIRIQSGDTRKIPHGADASVGFPLDKTWWSFRTKFAVIEDKPYLLIPKTIEHNERRQFPRCNFSPREQVKVTVMEGLGSGSGVFGMAKDVCVDGMSMQIEKAMLLNSEKEVVPTPTLFSPKAGLAIVKVNRIPGAPLLEVSGVANRVYRDSKWYFAFQFSKLSKAQEQVIARFVEPRVLDFKPTRRSFKKRQELEDGLGSAIPNGSMGSSKADGNTDSGNTDSTDSQAPLHARKPPTLAQEAADAGKKVEKIHKVLVVGDLIEELAFLGKDGTPFEVLPGSSPVGIIKALTESTPALLVCGVEFKGRSMVEVLEKIVNMGVNKDTRTVVCATELPSKDRIKFKMLNIDRLIEPPDTSDYSAFIEKLLTFID